MSTKAKYTPGPWEITGFADCQLITKDTPPAIGQPVPIGKTYGENQIANARLIAAAPDLLAEAIELLRNATYADGVATVLTHDCEALEAAIAKATEAAS